MTQGRKGSGCSISPGSKIFGMDAFSEADRFLQDSGYYLLGDVLYITVEVDRKAAQIHRTKEKAEQQPGISLIPNRKGNKISSPSLSSHACSSKNTLSQNILSPNKTVS